MLGTTEDGRGMSACVEWYKAIAANHEVAGSNLAGCESGSWGVMPPKDVETPRGTNK